MPTVAGKRLELTYVETDTEIIVSFARARRPGQGALGPAAGEDRRKDKPVRALFCTPQVRAILLARGWRAEGPDMVHDPKEPQP